MFDDATEILKLKVEFCKYLQIPFLKNTRHISVNLLYAPAIITYKNEDYAFIDTVLCAVVRNSEGQYIPLKEGLD